MRTGLLALLCVTASVSHALVQRHDISDPNAYLNAANGLPIGLIVYAADTNDKRSCVLISDQYVLTAAHNWKAQPGNPTSITIAGNTYTVTEWTRHPSFDAGNYLLGNDISVAKLNTRVRNIAPMALFSGFYTPSLSITVAGFGATGNGLVGINSYPWVARAGENAMDFDPDFTNVFLTDFDRVSPATNLLEVLGSSPTPRALECNLGFGDSGGPAIVLTSGVRRVAGIASAIFDLNENAVNSDYGDGSLFSKTGPLTPWINATTWEPGRVDGKVNLSNFTPTATNLRTASIRVFNVGTSTLRATFSVPLAIDGGFSFVTPLRGNYDLRFDVPGFLPKRLTNVAISTTAPRGLAVTLGNGNCDGDTEVGPSDFDTVVANFGSNATAPEMGELDGDGEVGPSDFDIVVAMFGVSGDN